MEVIREREVHGGDCGSTVGSTDPTSTSGSETAVSVLDTGHTYSQYPVTDTMSVIKYSLYQFIFLRL